MDAHARRNWFLVLAVFVANAFLVVFGTEALVSILNVLALKANAGTPLTGLRDLLGLLTFLLWGLTILALIFVPHLPKSILLPPVLALLWEMIGAPPLKWSMADPQSWLKIDAIALASVAWAFLGSKISYDSWFLRAGPLPYKENLLTRTLIALPVALILIVGGISVAVVGGVKTWVESSTAGYLHLSATGIEVREAVFRKDDREVHLVGTVHFAEPWFYRNLYGSIPTQAVILAEGVTDRDGKMKGGLSYNNVAGTIGLESQDVFEELLGPPQEPAAAAPAPAAEKPAKPAKKTEAQPPVAPPPPPVKPAVVRADIDIADLTPVTLRFLERVGEVYASKNFQEAMAKLTAVSTEFTEADINAVMNDIVAKRNTRVLAELDKQLPQYKVVYIPWGAQHMPGLQQGLLDRGFKLESRKYLPLARYSTVVEALQKVSSR